jgi:hypothetical protein
LISLRDIVSINILTRILENTGLCDVTKKVYVSTGNRTCLVHLSVDSIYRITAILNYETCIIASIAMSPIGRVIMLVKMYVEIFKTDVIVFIGIEPH